MAVEHQDPPPVEMFTEGGVWLVGVDRPKPFVPAGESPVDTSHFLVLVRRGVRGANRWARTKLAMGDLQFRTLERIFADFVILMRQPRPVPANYISNLKKERGQTIRWLAYKGDCNAETP